MGPAKFVSLIFVIGIFAVTAQEYRLPKTVSPQKYVVDLKVPEGVFNGTNAIFEGTVQIYFTVLSAITEIKLHHRATNVSVDLSTSSGITLPVANTSYNSSTEIYTITVGTTLSAGANYTLQLAYTGQIELTAMRGFYRSTYLDESNKTVYMLTTQFQPTSARHGFPCFDEPEFKATFVISLTYPNSTLNALSNTDSVNTTNVDGTYVKTTFKETTKMSTYLIAFIISDFTCSEEDTIETGVRHQVCSRKEEEADRQFAVEVGPPLLRTLESLTGLKYGAYMPKMDQVAIPDFSAGAMENWGLVTYRETGLLFNEEHTANSYKKSIAQVIAHEFTHMWFGDLVTCQWWDYTFLNEGFARFYQYFAAAATQRFLDWELDKHFVVEQVQTALLADSTASAQALTSQSASPSEVSGKFSTISYNKGASIIRMIEKNIMGAENFVYGIRAYLAKYQSQATIPANLWSSLSDYVPSVALPSNGVNLSQVLENWVEQSGHPVVYATKSGNDVILSQQRFLLSAGDNREYYVPITYTVSSDITKFSNTTVRVWLEPGKNLTLTGALSDGSWIVLNNRQSGFYRVDYDSALRAAINSQLHSNHLAIDVLNRAQIVSDAYNFARAGRNGGYGSWTYADIMSVLTYLEHEEDYYPWYATIVGNNHVLQRIGYESETGKNFTAWMLTLLQNVYKTVPFDTLDSSNQVYTMKQVLILNTACKYGHAACISKSKELFSSYRNGGISVPKNLRTIVYCYALKYSDDATNDFNFLWRKYGETKLMSEILTILRGLGCSEDTERLKWYLGQTINATSGIRLQDFTSVWSYVYSSGKVGTTASLEYIAENYQALNSSYEGVGTLISNIAGYIYEESQLESLEKLVNVTGISASHKQTVQSVLNSTKTTIDWAKTLKQDIDSYLNTQTSDGLIAKSSSMIILIFFLIHKLIL